MVDRLVLAVFSAKKYFHDVKTYNFDLFHGAYVSFIPQAPFSWSIYHEVLGGNTMIGGVFVHWTEILLDFQLKFPFAHLSFVIPLLRFNRFIIVEKRIVRINRDVI